jgi:hypothetical protein
MHLAPGTVIGGDFAVERPLGRGGMGVVYLARQRSANRLPALELLDGGGVAGRFELQQGGGKP